MSRQGTSLPPARWARRLGLALLGVVAVIVSQVASGTSVGFTAPLTAAAAAPGPSGHPNRFSPRTATSRPDHLPKAPTANIPKPTFSQPKGPAPVPMKPALVALDPIKGGHFIGSDGVLELTVPPGAVTAGDVQAAGGSLNLLVRQVEPGSGSSAGGSGHVSFGIWLLQVVDGSGRLVAHGLRQSLELKLHENRRAGAVDLAHTQVLVNPSLPSWVNLDPGPTAAQVAAATGAQLKVQAGGVASTSPASATRQQSPSSSGSASSTSSPALGPAGHHPAVLDASTTTLVATVPMSTPSTGASFGTDAPVATFGRPDPFETDLAGGSLSAGIQLDLPAGPGGFTPPLTLSYSSASVSDQHNLQGAAPWVGEGWSMGLGAISWAEHQVDQTGCQQCTTTQWEDSWQLSDPFGTAADLVPPDVNVSTYLDDSGNAISASPITWHTAPETHAKVISFSSGIGMPNNGPVAPCWRVFLPNGIMEEFGCVANALQFYPEPGGTNNNMPYIANWLLDMITDPQGNQIHVTYQSDPISMLTMTYARDIVLQTVEYDSPGCHDAQNMCTGSNWAPLMRVNFAAGHTVAHVNGSSCPANGTLRCDDPVDLSGSGGLPAPAIQSDFVLNDAQVQVRSTGASWNTLRDYQFSYNQGQATTIPQDPVTGEQESVAAGLLLQQLQVIGADGTTSLPPRTFGYTSVTEDYEDVNKSPLPSSNCGPSWNNGAPKVSHCILWSQSNNGNSSYLSSVSNGLGLSEAFSWAEARNNFYGVVSGSPADPLACDNPNVQSSFPCNMPDNQTWSRAVLTQRTDSVLRTTGNPVTSTWTYAYQVQYPLAAQECTGCVASFYWGNQNDFDELDFYNNKFMGFAQAAVQNPDNGVEVHKFLTTQGFGLYDVNQLTCNTPHACSNDPYWALGNAAHGHEYELDQYDTNGTTLLRQTKTQWSAVCPPAQVGATPPNSNWGDWNHNLVTELDHSNPVMVCDVQKKQADSLTYDGTGQGPAPDKMTSYTYDSYGRVASQSTVNTTGVFDSSGHGNHAVWSGGVSTGAPGLVSGDGDTAMTLDGSSGEIDTGYVQSSVTAESAEAWVKTTDGGTRKAIVQDRGAGGGQSLTLGLTPAGGGSGDPFFELETNGAEVGVYGTTPIDDGRPHQVVGTWSGSSGSVVTPGQFALYVDGAPATTVSIGTSGPAAPLSGQGGAKIGRSDAWGTFLSGTVGEVAIYGVSLQQGRVQAHYTAGSGYAAAVMADSPLAYYRLNDGTVGTNAGPNTTVDKPQYIQDNNVTPTSTSATGRYLIDYPAFDDVEDPSGNRYQCSYTSYDNQAFRTGDSTGLTLGEKTTADRYTGCGNSGNGFSPSGQIRTTSAYDLFGNQVASSDPDANAGVAGHAGCFAGGANQSACTTYDGTFGTLPVSTSNALNQASSTGYQVAASATGAGGLGLWPISSTDPNAQSTTTAYDALGRATSQTKPPVGGCPAGWSCVDIGSPVLPGSQGLSGSTWTVQGTGGDIWGTSDQFHLVSQSLPGDGAVSARVVSQASTDVWAKAGVMLRQSADAGSAYYAAEVTPGNGIVVQYRSSAGAAATMPVQMPGMAPAYLQVVRSGTSFSAYASPDGTNWVYLPGSATTLSVSGAMLAGLAAASHNTAAAAAVTFDSVTIVSASCPLGWSCADVQTPFPAGGQSVSGGGWTVQSGSGDIWGTSDQFHYIWQSLAGNGAVSAEVTTENATDPWAKAGVMFRQTADPSSAYYAALVTPGNGVVVQYRASAGASAITAASVTGTAPVFLRVDRSGTSFSASTSSDGVTWTPVPSSSATLSVSGAMLAGVAVSGHSSTNAAGISDVYVGAAPPAATTCPAGWSCADVGTASTPGTQSVSGGSWTVNSSGFDIWGTSDQFHYVWQPLAGDGTLSGRIASQGSSDPWAKAGLMVRQSSDPASAYYAIETTPGNGIVVQYRPSSGASAVTAAQVAGAAPAYVRAVREGSTFGAAVSNDGVAWTSVANSTVTMSVSGTMLAGLAVSPHSSTTTGTATFDTLTLVSAPSVATVSTAYTVWCSGTTAQTPCVEVDRTQRLNSTTTVTSRSFYDGLGHLVETRSPAPGGQDVVRYSFYDASQRLAFQSVPYFVAAYNGPPGSAAYSTPDTTQPGTTYDSGQATPTTGKYDALGRLLITTDPLGHTSTTSYSVVCAPAGTGDPGCFEQTLTVDPKAHQGGTLVDGLGRTAYVQRYTGNSTSTYALYATAKYTHDFVGNLVNILQPDGLTQTTFGYDMAGRKTSMTDPDVGAQSYTYDQDGNLTESVDARGSSGTIFMGYDGLDRPTARSTNSDLSSPYDTYTYDSTANGNVGVGHLTAETFATGPLSGSYAYTYDARGQRTNSTLTVGGTSYPLGTSYDDAGNALAQTYPDGETITTSYTAQGWLGGVTTSQGSTTLVSNLTYSATAGGAFGEITGASLGSGTYTYSATYDLLDRATDLRTTKTSGGAVMFDQSRTFDGAGNVGSISTTMPGATDNQSFCYDEQDRLTWASAATATPPCGGSNTAGTLTAAQYTQTFSYDVLGRLTSGPLGTYTYGDPAHAHAATAIGTAWTSAYDAAGDMTCRAPSSSTTCAGTQTGAQLGYNNEGQLQSWQNAPSSPSTTAQSLYDGQGQRVEQSVTQSGTTTNTVYVGDVEEVSTTGGTTTTTAYYYMAGKRIGLSVNGTVSYLASDGLGSATVTLSGGGSAAAAQLFAPYGAVRYSSGAMPTTYGFTGQRSDAPSGLDYYGARYYDALAGQFTSGDNVLPGGGFDIWSLSRYAYVGGNPENRTDPTGHINLSLGDDGSAVPIDNAFQGTYSWGSSAVVTYHRGFTHPYPASRSRYQKITAPKQPAKPKPPDTPAHTSGPDAVLSAILNAISSPTYSSASEEEAAQEQAQAERDNADWFNNAVQACDISAHCSIEALALMAASGGKFEIDEANVGHMFRTAPGHFAEDTATNRQTIMDTANDPANYVGTDSNGVATYRRSLSDGRQAWAEIYNGKITNGGVNDVPRS